MQEHSAERSMADPQRFFSSETQHVLVTGGAGYIGSLLTGVLLNQGYEVTVVDDLLFGVEFLLGYWHHPRFRFTKADICDRELFEAEGSRLRVGTLMPARFDAIVHLAAVVGFPACHAVGKEVAWRYNVEATERVFEAAEAAGVGRFVFSSSYSNYGIAKDGRPVTEESPLYPQSLYAETKIAAEQYVGVNGSIIWDTSKPNGQPRRKLDITRAREQFGFESKTPFEEGLRRTIERYVNRGTER